MLHTAMYLDVANVFFPDEENEGKDPPMPKQSTYKPKHA